MMVDKTPVLVQEGDLVIIGPQRHGVPPMPEIEGGSIRLSVEFWPHESQGKGNSASSSASVLSAINENA